MHVLINESKLYNGLRYVINTVQDKESVFTYASLCSLLIRFQEFCEPVDTTLLNGNWT